MLGIPGQQSPVKRNDHGVLSMSLGAALLLGAGVLLEDTYKLTANSGVGDESGKCLGQVSCSKTLPTS